MYWWWDKQVNKEKVIKMFETAEKTIKIYEDFDFGITYLVPKRARAHMKTAINKIKKTSKVRGYVKDLESVYNALQVLNNNETINNPALAALAYGKLFKGAAVFISKLPPPAKEYGGILDNLGNNFPAIVRNLMPSAHGSEGLEADFQAFLKGSNGFINGIR